MTKFRPTNTHLVWLVLLALSGGLAWQIKSVASLKTVASSQGILPPSSTIVNFDNPAARSAFLDQNHLKSSDLKPVAGLDAYVAPVKPDQASAPSGAHTHPNYQYKVLSTPNDPLFPQQWWLTSVNAGSSWNMSTGSSSVTIAMVDTGFALGHEDLASQWVENGGEEGTTKAGDRCWTGTTQDKKTNNCDDDADGYVDDWRGWDFAHNDNDPNAGTTDPYSQYVAHGTMTAGLAGAAGNNGKGGAGMAYGSKLLPLEAMDDSGTGYTDQISSAIRYAADHGAKVISLSLGSTSPDYFMQSQIDYAIGKGVAVVAAAGNSGDGNMVYPANFPEVISVGAVDQNDNRAGFSSYGPNLDVVAPGSGSIVTTFWSASDHTSSYTASVAGTSIATPIVSGLAALIYSRLPSATPDDIMRTLARSATKVPGMGGQTRTSLYGYGRIEANQALIDVSLATPGGQLLNKHSISLNASSGQTTGPDLVSTCETSAATACDIRLTSPDGSTIKLLGAQTTDDWGGTAFSWNALSQGLTAGRWKVEAVTTTNGQTAVSTDYLQVNP